MKSHTLFLLKTRKDVLNCFKGLLLTHNLLAHKQYGARSDCSYLGPNRAKTTNQVVGSKFWLVYCGN